MQKIASAAEVSR